MSDLGIKIVILLTVLIMALAFKFIPDSQEKVPIEQQEIGCDLIY